MAIQTLIPTIVSVGGLAVAIATTYVTVRSFYDRRRNEDRQRQREELDRLQAARQKELDSYAEGKQKEYAAKRDFDHLLRQYDSLAANINTMMNFHREEMNDIETDLKELKAMMNALLVQVAGSESSIIRYRKQQD